MYSPLVYAARRQTFRQNFCPVQNFTFSTAHAARCTRPYPHRPRNRVMQFDLFCYRPLSPSPATVKEPGSPRVHRTATAHTPYEHSGRVAVLMRDELPPGPGPEEIQNTSVAACAPPDVRARERTLSLPKSHASTTAGSGVSPQPARAARSVRRGGGRSSPLRPAAG